MFDILQDELTTGFWKGTEMNILIDGDEIHAPKNSIESVKDCKTIYLSF